MPKLYLFAGAGALLAVLLVTVYLWGRSDCRAACEKRIAALAVQEIDEKDSDDAAQAQTASIDSTAIRNDIARLRRLLAERNANDTAASACGLAGESDSVLDDHAEIFETGLPALPGLDGE